MVMITRSTAASRGIKVTGTPVPCRVCAISKARQKAVPKATIPRSKIIGERLFVDITSPHPQTHSIGGAKDWLVVLDDATDNAWNFFLPKKSCLSDTVLVLIKDLWVRYKMRVKIIRCDNAGENMAFMRAAQ